jgi:hypothetical protein
LLACPLHWGLQRWEDVSLEVTRKQLRLYFFLSIGLAIVELLNALSMSILPGSWYALLKGSDIGFSMALSRWVLGKRYHFGQTIGSGLVMGGIGIAFILGPSSSPTKETPGEVVADNSFSLTVASALCLCGACLNAGCAVLTEATLKETLKEEEHRTIRCGNCASPSKLLLSNAYSMWTTLFSFSISSVPAILSGQLQGAFQDANIFAEPCSHDDSSAVSNASALFTSMLLLLGVSRFGERLSKHWICVADSAITFSLVQAARRLSGIFILAALFQEVFPRSMTVGSSCSAIGFALHCWYSRVAAADEEDSASRRLARHEYELVETAAEQHDEMHTQ